MAIFTFNLMEQWTGVTTPVFSLEVPDGVNPWDEEEKYMQSGSKKTFYDWLIGKGCKPVSIQQYNMLSNG
jgi:hypothetical protein